MNDRNRFRIAIKCNSCGFIGFQYWEWNGQQFVESGYDKCNCMEPAFELYGNLEHCTGLPAAKSYRGTTPEDLLIWESDIVSGLAFHKRGLIVWQNGGFGFMSEAITPLEKGLCNGADWKDFVSFANHHYLDEILGRFEIVGNVHEVDHE